MATNYMNLIGQYYPAAEAWSSGNPTVYANINWITTPIPEAELNGKQLLDYMTIKLVAFGANAEAEIIDGFESEALGSPHWYDSERDDQLNLIGAVATQSTMPYSCRPGINSAIVIDVNGTKVGTDATGFANDATTYDAEIVIDGVSTFVSIEGATAQTIDDLVTQIQGDLDLGTNPASVVLSGGNLTLGSGVYDVTSSINIVDTTLFSSITGYVAIGDASVGVTAAGTSEKIYKLHTNTCVDEAGVDAITW